MPVAGSPPLSIARRQRQFYGRPPLGATLDDRGCLFAVYSLHAAAIWLCLFDEQEKVTDRILLDQKAGGIWFTWVADIRAGQRYAYRVEGPEQTMAGSCFNPGKLLLDPYARKLTRTLVWSESMKWEGKTADQNSAADLPKCVVTAPIGPLEGRRPAIASLDRVLYEVHVRGFTIQHPEVEEALRGTYLGLCSRPVLEWLKALRITTVQLMPSMAFMSEPHLQRLGLVNYWGYNPVNLFCPDWRYAIEDPVTEFRQMVRTFHDAGIEVLLDVVYNHTAEGGLDDIMFSFKGFDSLVYYRYTPDRQHLLNYSGCGNSVRSEHNTVLTLIMDSMRYWVREMGVDGFRFDLAASLGREDHHHGGVHFQPNARFFAAVQQDPVLRQAIMVAEPWDIGEGGYQLGAFPGDWLEVNDRFRDVVRGFWRGDPVGVGELATRIMGSRDIFARNFRPMTAPVNHVTYHDGFTLEDLVSYRRRHNQDNGENGRDGHGHNLSVNHGAEGPSDDPEVLAKRLKHKRNLLATLFLARGTPHLLAGDERSRTQRGNNNAYCQDNEISWVDWSPLSPYQEALYTFLQRVLELRSSFGSMNLLYLTNETFHLDQGAHRVTWLDERGVQLDQAQWTDVNRRFVALALEPVEMPDAIHHHWLIVINGAWEAVRFAPGSAFLARDWHCVLNTAGSCSVGPITGEGMQIDSFSLALWHAGPDLSESAATAQDVPE